jgi:type II secretory ATPase GspE/PulE/Tfp pilus assembly ATPase PilB-like protein
MAPQTTPPLQSLEFEPLTNAVKIINHLLWQAFAHHISDLHFESKSQNFLIRYRQYGRMHTLCSYPHAVGEQIMGRLKVLCRLESSVKDQIREARVMETSGLPPLHFRVSFLPALFGEKAAMRVLAREIPFQKLTDLPIPEALAQSIANIINTGRGLFLVTGATGSGKTTTLYTLLKSLTDHTQNVMTFEDPIEYILSHATQVPIHSRNQLSYAEALKTVLRQDPDVLLIGEIRDAATAEIALQAALAGHLVLSSLHAGSVAKTQARLKQWDLPQDLIDQGLAAILHQELDFKNSQPILKFEFWENQQ